MKKILITTQLSNYNTNGKFILECDSGWVMTMGRVREMLRLNPSLDVTVTCPAADDVITLPRHVNADLWKQYGPLGEDRLHFLQLKIIPNALVTRYDFDWESVASSLRLAPHKATPELRYDVVLINDPMHLRNFKALFYIVGGYRPKFIVHSHFVDVPSCPKFPVEASLWLGQCEAALRADFNFWQCESALKEFFEEASKVYTPSVVAEIMEKSEPWDDGYSITEMTTTSTTGTAIKRRFDQWHEEGKVVIFVPNRVGGQGRSSDYTNCGKFMFDALPKIYAQRSNIVVIAGNPSQKFSNDELTKMCGDHGYVSLVDGTFTRDEYKMVAECSDIAVGLYDQDTYGGTASRECIERNCAPLWVNCNEYTRLMNKAMLNDYPIVSGVVTADYIADAAIRLIDIVKNKPEFIAKSVAALKTVVENTCSYEKTTPKALKKMGLL